MSKSLLTGIIGLLGRPTLSRISKVEAVGLYALVYRSTTLPLVGNHILIIGFFRQLFSWSDEVLHASASVIVLGVMGMLLAFLLLEPTLGLLLGQRFTETFATYRAEGPVLLTESILWPAIALNDLVNSLLQIAGRVTLFAAPVLVLGLRAMWLWAGTRADTLEIGELLHGLILGHFVLIAAFYAAKCAASAQLGHQLLMLWSTVAACAVGARVLILL